MNFFTGFADLPIVLLDLWSLGNTDIKKAAWGAAFRRIGMGDKFSWLVDR